MHVLAEGFNTGSMVFLFLAVGLALSFEFVNGFHDTANAVATVIYTHTLKPWVAVVWSGTWNLIGVLWTTLLIGLIWPGRQGTGSVAFTIVKLLPVELVLNVGSSTGFAMVFALLVSAIIWNLGTWYMGLPASSTHTLVGAILGVGLANSVMQGRHSFGEGVNWAKANEVFLSLLISPLVGFIAAGALLLLVKKFVHRPELFREPPKDQPPPKWVRGLLVLTCTGVSFGHGSNDGQKGMGLILLILVGILPATYALKLHTSSEELRKLEASNRVAQVAILSHVTPASRDPDDAEQKLSAYLKSGAPFNDAVFPALARVNEQIASTLGGRSSLRDVPPDKRRDLRTAVYLTGSTLGKLTADHRLDDVDKATKASIGNYQRELSAVTEFIPVWVVIAVACALGFGTMVGWKRIVVTVGEKIGKQHLTYAQGASAELVAATTIILGDQMHLPVSTTHVLSSGVAGTMAANRSGLQMSTLRNIALAWVLTLPVCVLLGAAAFSGGLFIIFHHLTVPASIVAVICLVLAVWRIVVVRGRRGAARVSNFPVRPAPVPAPAS